MAREVADMQEYKESRSAPDAAQARKWMSYNELYKSSIIAKCKTPYNRTPELVPHSTPLCRERERHPFMMDFWRL